MEVVYKMIPNESQKHNAYTKVRIGPVSLQKHETINCMNSHNESRHDYIFDLVLIQQ